MTEYVLDIETTMEPCDRIRLVGVREMGGDNTFYTTPEMLDVWLGMLTETDTIFTWNGARFDFPVLKDLWSINITGYNFKHVDMYLFAKMLKPDWYSHSLANVGKKLYPHKPEYHKAEPWVELKCSKKDFYNLASVDNLKLYCGQDLVVTVGVTVMLKLMARKAGGKWAHPIQVEGKIADITERQVRKKVSFDLIKASSVWLAMHDRMEVLEKDLEHHLPVLPIAKPHMPPKIQFLKDGTPSKLIQTYCDKYGYNVVKIVETWMATNGTVVCILPLKKPLLNKQRITLAQQPLLKQWLLDQGWKPTMYNSVKDTDTGKWRNTTPRLTDRDTKEPCANLVHMGISWIPELSEWLMLRSRANLIKSSKGTGWFRTATNDSGLIPSDADTLGANTGRYIHKGIVNIPRVTSPWGSEMRSLFKAREGKVWVGWDASSLEACMEAHYTYPFDKAYANALVAGDSAAGTDVHSLNMRSLGLPNRDVAKTFKYAITYGAQPKKLAESLNVPVSQAREWFDEFWANNRALMQFKEALILEWKDYDKKYIVGLDGRLISTRSEHSLLNAKFQSAGTIVMKHACIIADSRIGKKLTKEHAYGLIRYHDEEVWETEDRFAPWVLNTGIASIADAGRFLKLNVPITGAGKIGNNWAEVH